ncbi:uncharacterized protein LY89DRAFT_668827 [Mollisia scopiformis]|uniref:Zn(2)-C6 fungal-type domain-containing protein n=1 Tax=Mollisia scopiformis TaxID=149040 RepID=A0A194XCM8_MOLSC|nr:uncharacterized protein LY89DRAFT_668827 [Mollisia scopiformis]KUJ17507.1 hypothetical protein LY89DRAFT_668827 [Mollisia scopiformis]
MNAQRDAARVAASPAAADRGASIPSSSSTSNITVSHRIKVKNNTQKKRKSSTKVKTGCITCKVRRVKCDETKPKCQRCIKFGIECDGYRSQPPVRPKRTGAQLILPKKEKLGSPEHSFIESIARLYGGNLDEADGSCFRLYLEETATQINSVFPSSLWERLVPQISQAEPFVRHAIIAIGALAKQSKSEGRRKLAGKASTTTDLQHALKQYDKSLRGMRDAIADGQHDLRKALIACLLVYCFENMLGNQLSAAKHAESGLMLLYQWTTGKNLLGETWGTQKLWTDHLFEEDLLGAFNSLDLQVLLFVDNRSKEVHERMKESQSRTISSMPQQFSSLTEARQYWNLILTRNYHFSKSMQGIEMEKIQEQRTETPWEDSANLQTGELLLSDSKDAPASLKDEHIRYRIDIDKWTLASARLFASLATGADERQKIGAAILQVQAKVNHIMLSGSFFTTETAYDVFSREFKAIVTLSETILPYILSSYEGAAPRFHFEIGIVAALYLVGSRCRDYNVRTRAIELLFSSNIREGVWDALSVAHMAKWIRDIEMEGLEKGASIPEEKRFFLSAVNVDLYHRRALLGATQRTKEGAKQRETVLTW